MKGNRILLIATFIFVVAVVLFAFNGDAFGQTLSQSGNEYGSFEVYPSDPLWIGLGTDIGQHFKVDLWTNSGCEVAFTVGPKIGPFNIGAGLSFGVPKDKTDLLYLNADIAFGFNLRGFHWQSYDLFQKGQNSNEDFILLRQMISHKDYHFGIIGHNIQKGAETFKLFWGPYYDFGEIVVCKHNKFAITTNLNNTDNLWVTWIGEF